MPDPSPQARRLLAEALQRLHPGYANASHSILIGKYGNAWTEAALSAIDTAILTGPDEDE